MFRINSFRVLLHQYGVRTVPARDLISPVHVLKHLLLIYILLFQHLLTISAHVNRANVLYVISAIIIFHCSVHRQRFRVIRPQSSHIICSSRLYLGKNNVGLPLLLVVDQVVRFLVADMRRLSLVDAALLHLLVQVLRFTLLQFRLRASGIQLW